MSTADFQETSAYIKKQQVTFLILLCFMASPIPRSGIFDSLPFGFAQGKFTGVVPLKERGVLDRSTKKA
jgi:hypothetical protein